MKTTRPWVVAGVLLIVFLGSALYHQIYAGLGEEHDSIKKEIRTKTDVLKKQMAVIAKKPNLESELASLKELRKAESMRIIEGQTIALVAAELQNTVKGVLTSKGGTISSQRVEKPEDAGKFKIVSVTFDAALPDMRALSEAIYALETQTPSLIVRELDARVKNYRDPRELMIKLRVAGMMNSSGSRSPGIELKNKEKTLDTRVSS